MWDRHADEETDSTFRARFGAETRWWPASKGNSQAQISRPDLTHREAGRSILGCLLSYCPLGPTESIEKAVLFAARDHFFLFVFHFFSFPSAERF